MDKDLPPKEKLKQILILFSDLAIRYTHFTKIFLRYEMLENEISTPYYILPFIKSYYGNSKSEYEIKLIAFQIVSTLQLILLKSDDFIKYVGENVLEKENRDKIIRTQVDLLLSGGYDE